MLALSHRRLRCLLALGLVSTSAAPVSAQSARPVAALPLRSAIAPSTLHARQSGFGRSVSSKATAKGVGIGLLVGALAGAAVGAMIEASNEGGLPEVRKRYSGFGYAVFIPTGAVVGAVVGGIIGARKD